MKKYIFSLVFILLMFFGYGHSVVNAQVPSGSNNPQVQYGYVSPAVYKRFGIFGWRRRLVISGPAYRVQLKPVTVWTY